jgi:biopolymer transport protein ExbD
MPLSADVPDSDPINMTPMIDIVFNLLIFFMLSATYMIEEREIALSVPSVRGAAPSAPAPSEIVVNVHEDGRVSIDGQPLDAASLADRLRKAVANYPDQSVAIRGDEAARYQWIAEVLSIAKESGVRRMDVVVQEQRQSP